MTINEIIIDIIENSTNENGKPMRQAEIIKRLKETYDVDVSAGAFSNRLKNNNMTTNNVIAILDVLGYELVVRQKEDSHREYIAEHELIDNAHKKRRVIEDMDLNLFIKLYEAVERGEFTHTYVIKTLGINRALYYKLVNEYKSKTGRFAE